MKIVRNIICYHGHCLDGFASAYAAYCHFGEDAYYMPVYYGNEIEDDLLTFATKISEDSSDKNPSTAVEIFNAIENIYFVDFSLKPKDLILLSHCFEKIVTIDHHETAILRYAKFGKNSECSNDCELEFIFDIEKSGCILTWEYFLPSLIAPREFEYIQDRDLWKFKLSNTKAFTHALFDVPMTFEAWDKLFGLQQYAKSRRTQDRLNYLDRDLIYLPLFIAKGDILLAAQAKQVEMFTKDVYMRKICGFTVPVVNATKIHGSDIGNELSLEYPFCAIVRMDFRKSSFNFSLRSSSQNDRHENVAIIAETFGGGGHKFAAGFSIPFTHPFVIDWLIGEKSLTPQDDQKWRDAGNHLAAKESENAT